MIQRIALVFFLYLVICHTFGHAEQSNILLQMDRQFIKKPLPLPPVTDDNRLLSSLETISIKKFRLIGNSIFPSDDQTIISIIAIYRLDKDSIASMKNAGVPLYVIEKLAKDSNISFSDESQLDEYLKTTIGLALTERYKSDIRNHLLLYPDYQISSETLQDIKRRLTQYYFSKGYINTVAIIPDQKVTDSVITIKIIEGILKDVEITGLNWLNQKYIRSRIDTISSLAGQALNIYTLQERIYETLPKLRQDTRINNIHANLGPGIKQGEAILTIQVQEARPYGIEIKADNHNSPGIGSIKGGVRLYHLNLTGQGDGLEIEYGKTKGMKDYSARYSFPLNYEGTTVSLSAEHIESLVVVEPFDVLDIESKTNSISAGIRHPFYRNISGEFALGFEVERYQREIFILGERVPFPGSDVEGRTIVSVIRCYIERVIKAKDQVIALRSTASFGLDTLGATAYYSENGFTDKPQGNFSTWLGQFQFVRRFPNLMESQVLFRFDTRFSNKHLLSVEKIAIGGATGVRGYRENYMTADNGIVSSLECRIPVAYLRVPYFSKSVDDGLIQLAPFTDIGHGKNTDAADPMPSTLYSAGLGLRWSISKKNYFETYWGKALRTVPKPNDYDIQDDGIHFQIVLTSD